ncbi:predicted protein [Arabidopsis lyrata subsp. lyrata]|uniref:Predicted protein n=1 Tax=Arabidopsis lyrata subsp. lyrata TaxID=81972 RepID=D7L8E3_ARALL|nr:predicted protein [Arabidopsis lyrata subsp. lyrata]
MTTEERRPVNFSRFRSPTSPVTTTEERRPVFTHIGDSSDSSSISRNRRFPEIVEGFSVSRLRERGGERKKRHVDAS